jgi:hypothetical protein
MNVNLRESSLIVCTASTYLWYHLPEYICQGIVDSKKKGGYILSASLVWLSPPVSTKFISPCPDHPKATHQWKK